MLWRLGLSPIRLSIITPKTTHATGRVCSCDLIVTRVFIEEGVGLGANITRLVPTVFVGSDFALVLTT
jgi:hypothetical protein